MIVGGTKPVTPSNGGTASEGTSGASARVDHDHGLPATFATDAAVVHLAGSETITGVKTFTGVPVIASITNSGLLTLPTGPDTIVGRASTDTLTNKTLTTPTIADFTNATHDHSAANKGGNIPQASVTGLVAALAARPAGLVIAPASISADQTTITTITDITGLTLTYTFTSGRRYRVSVYTYGVQSTVAGDLARIVLTDGSNNVLQRRAVACSTANVNTGGGTLIYTSNALSGSTTVKVRCERATGTGNITYAATAGPSYLMIEDLGAI